MAFGQSAGPPANGKEIAQLAALFEQAGFTSFKEARHPFGLTQRQAGGKFTRDEVAELTLRLESDLDAGAQGPAVPVAASAARAARVRPARRGPDDKLVLASLPDDVIVAELELRGWACIPPC